VLAHGFADAGALPVSTLVLMALGAAITVAAVAIPRRSATTALPFLATGSRATRVTLRTIALLGVIAITVPAAFGSSDVATNPAPRLLFTVGWAGMVLVSALIGPWWVQASPLRLAAGADDDGPPHVWPAVGALVLFGVFEQVLEPSPLIALITIATYVVIGVAIAATAGGRGLAGSDPLEVTSAAIGSLAPFGRREGGLTLRSPRRGVAAFAPRPGLGVFLGVLTGINLVDAAAPAGSVSARLLLYAAIVGVAAVVAWGAARPAYLVPALIPAVAGHLGAHYLAPLLVDTQIAAVLASDPLGAGWNLLGLTGVEIVAEPIPPTAGLVAQLVMLILGHAAAMVVAADLAGSRLRGRAVGAALFPLRAAILASLLAGIYLRFGGAA
jgi:hypothetical protein